MRRAITFFPIVTLATVFALSASPARANQWNQLSYFTFNAPVELQEWLCGPARICSSDRT